MKQKATYYFAWILWAITIIGAPIRLLMLWRLTDARANLWEYGSEILLSLIAVVSATLALLIITRISNNLVGWLLMIPAFTISFPLGYYLLNFTEAPANPPFYIYLLSMYSSWSWVPFIFPILFIQVYFPDGRLLSPRWRWLVAAGLAMCLTFAFIVMFLTEVGPLDGSWRIPNPIGFIDPDELEQSMFMPIWTIALLSVAMMSFLSLFIRYRRSSPVEKAQIKWLLFATGVFVFIYSQLQNEGGNPTLKYIRNIIFYLSILLIPLAITGAIFRYRLYEIDLIIRRTLQYTILTALLALLYFGSVVLLQATFGQLMTDRSPLIIVVSTLMIAALFTPLRRRVQDFIDRRFYRSKYNAEQALERFSLKVRDSVDIDQISGELLELVDEVIEPEQTVLWLSKNSSS